MKSGIFLQTIIAEDITAGSKLIGFLLFAIFSLLVYIYHKKEQLDEQRHKEQKQQADTRHKDQLELIKKLDERQDRLEDKQSAQQFQIWCLNATINTAQGRPVNYDNTLQYVDKK